MIMMTTKTLIGASIACLCLTGCFSHFTYHRQSEDGAASVLRISYTNIGGKKLNNLDASTDHIKVGHSQSEEVSDILDKVVQLSGG